jgi:hypothetical protein
MSHRQRLRSKPGLTVAAITRELDRQLCEAWAARPEPKSNWHFNVTGQYLCLHAIFSVPRDFDPRPRTWAITVQDWP